MYLLLSDIVTATSGTPNQSVAGLGINDITYDSRAILQNRETLFVALTTGKRDGHNYIADAIERGCHYVIIDEDAEVNQQNGIIYITVPDTLRAYQSIAAWRRSQVDFPVIGITGSNGKTIVKEWLADTLEDHYAIVKTPKSYNSQIGLPQSVMAMSNQYTLGIFEAGISQPHEMSVLQSVLKPTIGIITNIGDAHDEAFDSKETKLREKLTLFTEVSAIIYSSEQTMVHQLISEELSSEIERISWGRNQSDRLQIIEESADQKSLTITLSFDGDQHQLSLPKFSTIERENLLHVVTTSLYLGVPFSAVQRSVLSLNQLPMRLQVLQGNRGNVIINDSYTSDLQAFRYALEYLESHYQDMSKLVITSSEVQSDNLSTLFEEYRIDQVLYLDRSQPLDVSLSSVSVSDTAILVKGRRVDRMEEVSDALASKSRTTTLEVHLPSLKENLSVFSNLLDSATQLILVVKASAYGSGSIHVSRYLAKLPIDYLAVAVLDEAIELREQGINLPMLLFNFSDYDALASLWKYQIEPEVYSVDQLKLLTRESHNQESTLSVHLKIETGLNRLGLIPEDHAEVIRLIKQSGGIYVKGIFSHLSSSDNPDHDAFTKSQYDTFITSYRSLSDGLGYKPMRHLLNTSGIVRHPQYQMDAVRLGLGLYGIDESDQIKESLKPVLTLTSRILQVKHVKVGDSISYGRSYIAETEKTIAVVGMGYADGLPRSSYQDGGKVFYKGQFCPFIGNICMDVCMIDVTGIPDVYAGDQVEIFGHNHPLQVVAETSNTISYEIISQLSPRVKRIYIED